MLTPVSSKRLKGTRRSFAIVASLYNAGYVDSMLAAAEKELKGAGAFVETFRVPGAYEIPIVAARLARTNSPLRNSARRSKRARFAAIICLGVILRGETVHAAHIGEAVSRALMELQLAHEVPLIHEVLLLENTRQADRRCLDPEHNRGREAAQAALGMAELMSRIPA
jgi:6,7-dimethyl-8-ribityllumazine synthase